MDAERPLQGCESEIMKEKRDRQRRTTLRHLAGTMSRDMWNASFFVKKRREEQQALLHGRDAIWLEDDTTRAGGTDSVPPAVVREKTQEETPLDQRRKARTGPDDSPEERASETVSEVIDGDTINWWQLNS